MTDESYFLDYCSIVSRSYMIDCFTKKSTLLAPEIFTSAKMFTKAKLKGNQPWSKLFSTDFGEGRNLNIISPYPTPSAIKFSPLHHVRFYYQGSTIKLGEFQFLDKDICQSEYNEAQLG